MADRPPNSASTYLELAWTNPNIKVGTGYDFAGRQLKDKALENVPDPSPQPGQRTFISNIHSVSTDEELKTRIRTDLKASIPMEGALITTENSYLSSVKTSDTSLTQIIQETVKDPPFMIEVSQAQLTETARKILDGPGGWKRFTDRYGEYFVYGYVPRALFSAICTIKTNEKKVRDEVQTSLDVNVVDVAGVGAALKSVAEKHSASISIDVNLEVTGLQHLVARGKESDDTADLQPRSTKTNKIEDVQREYENFQRHFKPQPYTALLCHYSVLNTMATIPSPMHQFAHLGKDIELLYKNLYTAQIEISTSSMVQASATSYKIAKLCDKISNLNLTQASQLPELQNEERSCLAEVDLWRLRSELIADATKLRNDKLNWGNWTEALSQKEWASGVLGVEGHRKYRDLRDEITYKQDDFRSDYYVGQRIYHDFILGDNDKIIVGFQITSWWHDGTNGWLLMKDGNVLDSEIKLQTSSYMTRGCHWQVEVWMVSKLLYEKQK